MTDLTRANESWLTSPTHQQWLRDQGQALVDFAKAARVPCGFAALDPFGRRPNNAPADTITTARMVHSFSLAHIQGLPGCAPLIDHGLAALAGPLRD
ncbi:MAG: AGE family epimerase/isomerase, partial [Pseudomonas sp.]|nr:AGE family epimerase/isomerase [Pseudomonas sp.]